MGVRRGKHGAKTPSGEAARAARMRGRAQTSRSGEQRNGVMVAVEGGRKGNSQSPARGREGCRLREQRGLDRMSRERGPTKVPPTEKVREHENVALVRWGPVYTQMGATSAKLEEQNK